MTCPLIWIKVHTLASHDLLFENKKIKCCYFHNWFLLLRILQNIMNTTFKMQVFEELIILSALWNFENLVDCLRCNALLAYVNHSRHSSPSSLKCLLFLKTKNPNAIENCENMVFWKVIKRFWHQKFSALLLSSMSVQKYNNTDDEKTLCS